METLPDLSSLELPLVSLASHAPVFSSLGPDSPSLVIVSEVLHCVVEPPLDSARMVSSALLPPSSFADEFPHPLPDAPAPLIPASGILPQPQPLPSPLPKPQPLTSLSFVFGASPHAPLLPLSVVGGSLQLLVPLAFEASPHPPLSVVCESPQPLAVSTFGPSAHPLVVSAFGASPHPRFLLASALGASAHEEPVADEEEAQVVVEGGGALQLLDDEEVFPPRGCLPQLLPEEAGYHTCLVNRG